MEENPNTPDFPEDNLFNKMEASSNDHQPLKFQRSGNNIVISGLCGGIAEYSNIDPGNIRLIALLSLLLSGWSILVYILLSFLTPADRNPSPLSDEEKEKIRRVNFKTVFSGLLILAGFYYAFQFLGLFRNSSLFVLPNRFIFPLIATGAGILILRKPASYFSAINRRAEIEFTRSNSDRIILGVCGGLGDYLNMDSSVLRVLFIVCSLLTLGLFAFVYIILGMRSKSAKASDYE